MGFAASAMVSFARFVTIRSVRAQVDFDWNIYSLPKVAIFMLMFFAPGRSSVFSPQANRFDLMTFIKNRVTKYGE
jgi:hypothetical protein